MQQNDEKNKRSLSKVRLRKFNMPKPMQPRRSTTENHFNKREWTDPLRRVGTFLSNEQSAPSNKDDDSSIESDLFNDDSNRIKEALAPQVEEIKRDLEHKRRLEALKIRKSSKKLFAEDEHKDLDKNKAEGSGQEENKGLDKQ